MSAQQRAVSRQTLATSLYKIFAENESQPRTLQGVSHSTCPLSLAHFVAFECIATLSRTANLTRASDQSSASAQTTNSALSVSCPQTTTPCPGRVGQASYTRVNNCISSSCANESTELCGYNTELATKKLL